MPNHPAITAIDTRTAGFIGAIPGAAGEPGAVHSFKSWAEFNRLARLLPHSGRAWNHLAHAVQGFFLNGGAHCLVAECPAGDERGLAAALEALAAVPDVATLAAPGWTSPAAYATLTGHVEARRDRLAILDGPAGLDDSHLKVMSGQAATAGDGWQKPPPATAGFTTLYIPWIRVADPEGPAGATLLVPPAGHIAGAWARHDAAQGVHKAPANLTVSGALDVARHFTPAEQDRLNPHGINTLRDFPGRGVVIWGGRTLSPDPEWRYVNVRRTLTLIEQSIRRSTGWVVFEPNDEPLWARLRATVENFLFTLWRGGALAGDKPEHGFFARCDRSTMTPADRDAGRVILLLGVALLRPAEFTTLRIVIE